MAKTTATPFNESLTFLEPEITRAFWSARRARHGEAVRLHVETRFVPDGTALDLEIWEDDSGENNPDDFVAEMKGEHQITGNRCVIDYTIQWDDESLGKELELEGPELEFYFLVTIDALGLRKRSGLLLVDLIDYQGSF